MSPRHHAHRLWRATPRRARQVLVAIPASALMLTGGAMLVLPGPGLLVILAGLTLLAAEFHWARRALIALRGRYEGLRTRVVGGPGGTEHPAAYRTGDADNPGDVDNSGVKGTTDTTMHRAQHTPSVLPALDDVPQVRASGEDPATV